MSDRFNREYIDRQAPRGQRPQAEKKPYLYPACVEGAPERLQVIISNAESMRQGTACLVSFREPYRGFVLWVARGDLRNLCDQLGEDVFSEMAGRYLWLEKVRRTDPHRGGMVEKYVPAPPVEVTRGTLPETADDENEPQAPRRMRPRF